MKVIVRIKGGLGNQLYCYAAARQLAIKNDAELVIDHVSGFKYDRQYKRQYELSRFRLPFRLATDVERFEPFPIIRRALTREFGKFKSLDARYYIAEWQVPKYSLAELEIKRDVYIDGLWQSQRYFSGISDILRGELISNRYLDEQYDDLFADICKTNSVAIHIRWFNDVNIAAKENVPFSYYGKAIEALEKNYERLHYFVFTDKMNLSTEFLDALGIEHTLISKNIESADSVSELLLMSKCKHLIIGNSTFSWWGAWLSEANRLGRVYFPRDLHGTREWGWDFSEQMPENWNAIHV